MKNIKLLIEDIEKDFRNSNYEEDKGQSNKTEQRYNIIMNDNMKQLLDALCNFDVEVNVNGTYGKLEKLGKNSYWVEPKRGEGFALEGEMLKNLQLSGAVYFSA